MKALRIISGTVGFLASVVVCVPLALEWVLNEGGIRGAAIILIEISFSLAALAGPFALLMSATLAEGQYTRANCRLLIVCLGLGTATLFVSIVRMWTGLGAVYIGATLLTLVCMPIAAWCILKKREGNP